jgi:uncharacterized membrane protein
MKVHLYRGITGHWPHARNGDGQPDSTKGALGGDRGVHVRESIRVEVPVVDVYQLWRRLDNLPKFMTHLDRVSETADGKSHWVALGPAGLVVQWDAESSKTRYSHGVRFPGPTSSWQAQ